MYVTGAYSFLQGIAIIQKEDLCEDCVQFLCNSIIFYGSY